MKEEQLHELLYQALETEQGGIKIYETAIRCARNADLRAEWEEFLEQTENHESLLIELMQQLDLDPERETSAREVVRHIGASLVKAMEMALDAGDADAAQIVASECVVLAETKDHQNWELLGQCANKAIGPLRKQLEAVVAQVEDEEDEHLYHGAGWARELWIDSLGLPAALPPPEEQRDAKTAIEAAEAKAAREESL